MTRRAPDMALIVITATACLAFAPGIANANSTARYALVVGNDFGNTQAVDLPNLRHAEAEARRLKKRLVELGNFNPDRVLMVSGGSRQEIMRAAKKLAAIHRRDRKLLSNAPTLFAIFFTGHGLSGELLTADDPLTGVDLAKIVSDMNATLTVGFFDACFAGSIDLNALVEKGAISTPGFNPVSVLPNEVLSSEGTMWFVSSKEGQVSYEDDELGGLFTHYFVEAFTHAPQDQIGVTLESMWEYSRSKTLARASRFGRTQTPEKVVKSFKTHGPIYFSFPRKRSASLVFDKAIAGTFLLQYQYGALVEKLSKKAGATLEVPVFEGQLILSKVEGEDAAKFPAREITVRRGAEVRVYATEGRDQSQEMGYGEVSIRSKGQIQGLAISESANELWWMLGPAYRFTYVGENLLGADHIGVIESWFGYGRLSIAVGVGLGQSSATFQSWSYETREVDPFLRVGYGLNLRWLRLDLELAGGPQFHRTRYENDVSRFSAGGRIELALGALVPIPKNDPWIVLGVRAGAANRWAQGIVREDDKLHSSLEPVVEAGLFVPISEFFN